MSKKFVYSEEDDIAYSNTWDLGYTDEDWEEINSLDNMVSEIDNLQRKTNSEGFKAQPIGTIYSGILKKWIDPITGEEKE